MPQTPGLDTLIETPLESISCQICGKENTIPVFFKFDRFQIDTRPFNVVRCTDCDYFYVNPRPRPENLMNFYPDTYAFQEETQSEPHGLARFFKSAEAFYRNQGLSHDIRRVLAVTRKIKGMVVEIGCATGDRLKILKEKGFQVLGIEPGEAAREYGRKHFGLPIAESRLEDWEGPQTPADIICIFNVLEHLPYPVQQLKRLVSWLKDDGVLVIQIPNSSSLQARLLGARWSSVDVPRDLFYFSPNAMRTAARLAGLEIKKIEYGHHWMHPPTLVSSLFPAIDPAVIWSEEAKLSGPVKKILWAAATLMAIPAALFARLFSQSSLMTLYLKKVTP